MTTHKVLYEADALEHKVSACARWIDGIGNQSDYILCPILQSGYQLAGALSKYLTTQPLVDFFGITANDSDNTPDSVYIYKSVDMSLLNNKIVVIVDVLASTGRTMDYTAKIIKQFGAKKVYTACLLKRQWCKSKIDWVGYKISDEVVYGYGLDLNNRFRTLTYIAYE